QTPGEPEIRAEPAPAEAPEHDLAGPPESTVDFIAAIEDGDGGAEPTPRRSWFQRLTSGLKRSSDQLTGSITSVFTKKKLDAEMLEELEDVLIQADFGLEMATTITETLRRDRFERDITAEEVRGILADEVARVLEPVAKPLVI